MESVETSNQLTKAALLMLSLDQRVLAMVLKHLKPDEVTRVMQYIEANLTATPPTEEQLATAGKEFLDSRGGKNPSSHLKEALTLAFGGEGAERMLRQDNWRLVAERADPAALAAMLQDERPQAAAIVLSQLPPRYAADVLGRLPEESRPIIVDRISRSERVASPALDAMLRAIEENLAGKTTVTARNQPSGVQRAAALLSQLDSEGANKIVDLIRSGDAKRAAAIEQEMFRFEDLLKLDNKALQMVLSEFQPERLALALKGIAQELRDKVFAALPETNAKIVKEELETSGAIPLREVQAARRELINLAVQLDREGKIRLRADEEMVA